MLSDHRIETALTNWLGDAEVTDVEADLEDFMANVADDFDGEMTPGQLGYVEDFARSWLEERRDAA